MYKWQWKGLPMAAAEPPRSCEQLWCHRRTSPVTAASLVAGVRLFKGHPSLRYLEATPVLPWKEFIFLLFGQKKHEGFAQCFLSPRTHSPFSYQQCSMQRLLWIGRFSSRNVDTIINLLIFSCSTVFVINRSSFFLMIPWRVSYLGNLTAL